jgi:hypothetical protein
MIAHVHNNLKNKLQEVGLNETQFVQNRLGMWNFPSMTKAKHFPVRPNFIQQRVRMNDVQLEVRMSKKFTPSSSKLKLMNGIPQIPIIVSQE